MALMQHERRACLGIAEVVNGGKDGFAFFLTQPFWSHHGALLRGKMQDQEGVARLVFSWKIVVPPQKGAGEGKIAGCSKQHAISRSCKMQQWGKWGTAVGENSKC